MVHGQCDARPTVTSPAAGHHSPSTATKLYCSVTEAHVCEQLAQGCCLKAERPIFEPELQVQCLNLYATGHIGMGRSAMNTTVGENCWGSVREFYYAWRVATLS